MSALLLPLCALLPQLHFTERTAEAGLMVSLEHAPDHPAYNMDGGGTIGDFDRDGWPDVFIPSTGLHPNRLFLNQGDGTFRDEAPPGWANQLYRGCGSTVGDVNGDGWPDIYVTSHGKMGGPPRVGDHRLYINLGDGKFQRAAAYAGVNETSSYWPDGFGPVFGDYDLDGDLDLYVTGWHEQIDANHLFRNRGDGTFERVTVSAGVDNFDLKGFGATFADMDGDLYPELLVAGDFGTSLFFHNQGDGTFTELPGMFRPDKVYFGMGADVGDLDADGDLDWFITATYWRTPNSDPNGNRMYMNRGPGKSLLALPSSAGLDDGGWGWGTVMGDFDHDGFLDVLETNGWNRREWEGEPNYLYRSNGDGTFTDVAVSCNIHDVDQGRGLLRLDYDRDGDLDALFFSNEGRPHLYRNELAGPQTHWLVVEVETDSRSDLAPGGYGTRVEVHDGAFHRTTTLHGGSNYLGRSEMVAHFGLGWRDRLDEVRVRWANGEETVLRDVAADQHLFVSPPAAHGAGSR